MDIHPNQKEQKLQAPAVEQMVELSLEMDHLLADYQPDIFKIIQCDVLPAVVETTVSEDNLTVQLETEIRILYLAEQTHRCCVITQKQQLQKVIMLPQTVTGSQTAVSVTVDGQRCRAVNPRRIDLRATLMLRVMPEYHETIRYFADDTADLQLCQSVQNCLIETETAIEELTVTERSGLPYGKPPIEKILLYRTTPIIKEIRRSGDNVICKGNIRLHLLYEPQQSEHLLPESAEFIIPVDAVISTVPGNIGELTARMELLGTELNLNSQQRDGGVEGQYHIRFTVMMPKTTAFAYVSDLYSTEYPVRMHTEEFSCLSLQGMVDRTLICKHLISVSGGISQVVDLFGEVLGSSLQTTSDGEMVLSVNLQLDLFAADENGMLFCTRRVIPCELKPELFPGEGEPIFEPKIHILSENYRLTESGELEIRTELQLIGAFCRRQKFQAVTEVEVDTGHPYEKEDAALHLYYGKTGESLWTIAKQFQTDYARMLAENEIGDGCLTENRMLLIPSIS